MSANHIHISHLGIYVSTQHMYYACLMTHLALNGNFTTSELRAINCYCMYKGIFFISDICNHQENHLHKSSVDTDNTLNTIHYFNWPRRHHKTISEKRTWKKSIRTLFDESKVKICAPLGQWKLENNKYITSWQFSYPMISTDSITENMEHG